MKLIIGLGNPEKKYEGTRHNVGFLVADALKGMRSSEFMNDSGLFVKKILKKQNSSLDDLYIAHDDLDIPLGSYKIQFAKGPKDHNGIKSVEEQLGTDQFWRIRVGIENRDVENRISGEIYTLQEFLPEEKKIIADTIKELCRKISLQ